MTNEIAVTFLPGDTITAAKLNAMQQSLAVEGDYTSYKFVWGANYTGVADTLVVVFNVSNTGTVSMYDDSETTIYKKTYSGATASTTDLDYNKTVLFSTACGAAKSVLHTYYAFPLYSSGKTLLIFKNDSLLQTIDITTADATSDQVKFGVPVVFSPNGRYFAFVSEVVGASAGLYVSLYEADV